MCWSREAERACSVLSRSLFLFPSFSLGRENHRWRRRSSLSSLRCRTASFWSGRPLRRRLAWRRGLFLARVPRARARPPLPRLPLPPRPAHCAAPSSTPPLTAPSASPCPRTARRSGFAAAGSLRSSRESAALIAAFCGLRSRVFSRLSGFATERTTLTTRSTGPSLCPLRPTAPTWARTPSGSASAGKADDFLGSLLFHKLCRLSKTRNEKGIPVCDGSHEAGKPK
jgi:hypothetical protein